jgi:hypothetical protein
VPANKQDQMDFFEQIGYTFSLINKTWEAFKVNWQTFVVLYLLPLGLLMLWLPFAVGPQIIQSDAGQKLSIALVALVTVVLILVMLLIAPAITLTQVASVKGKRLGLDAALNQSKKYVLRYIGSAIIISAVALAPLFFALLTMILLIGFLILPFALVWAVLVYMVGLLVPFVLVTQDKDIKTTLQSSYELAKQNWRWILAVLVVVFVINLISAVPLVGWVIAIVLGVMYYCLPAYVFVNHIQKPIHQTPVSVIESKVTESKKSTSNKKAKPAIKK